MNSEFNELKLLTFKKNTLTYYVYFFTHQFQFIVVVVVKNILMFKIILHVVECSWIFM